MTNTYRTTCSAALLGFILAFFGSTAQAAPELRASATEVMVGESIEIQALSGSSMLPVYAKSWNVSPEFSLMSAGRVGAKIRAIAPGEGVVSANVNLKEVSVGIRVLEAKAMEQPVPSAPATAATATPSAPPAQSVIAAPPSQSLSACEQDMLDRKRDISNDFSAGRYEAARSKLLDLKKSWQDDARWAEALLGAIEQISPATR
jgi:hypothetical protein